MARTKRKTNPLVQESAPAEPAKKNYQTAAYVRLSVEDSGKPGADTIEGQKALLLSFVERQDDIHEMVVTLIRTYAAYAVSLEHLLLLQKERIQVERKQSRRELAVLQSRKNQLEKALQDLYEKLIDGTMDKESYLAHKAGIHAQMEELTGRMERLEQVAQNTTEQGGAFIEKYKEYAELDTLTAEAARDFVKRVTVYKDGGIEIELALRDELEALLNQLENVDAAS